MNFTYRDSSGHTSTCLKAALALSFCVAAAHSALGQTTGPMRTIIPVHFDGSNGDIIIGSTTYKGTQPGFHLVALTRLPNRSHLDAPDVVIDQNLTSSQAVIDALTRIQTNWPDAMIMVNTSGAYGFPVWPIGSKLLEFGGTDELGGVGNVPLAFVGNAGRAKATADLIRWNSMRPVDGYLAPDSNGNYAFIQTDFIRYDIMTNGDITIGKKSYAVANSYRVGCNGQNSFHMVIVDREDPSTLYADNTYCTASLDNEWTRLISDLNVLVNAFKDETRLVFIASNGKPIPANWNFGTNGDPRIYPFAQEVNALGGHWETMVYLTPNDTYSLVGAVWQPPGTKGALKRGRESSSVYPEISQGKRPSGELHGVLARRGRGNWYGPLNADPSGYANMGFYEVLATPSAAFPHPIGAAEIAAFQAINNKLCSGCNIRDAYDDLNVNFSNYLTQLQAMTDSSGRSCDASGSTADVNFCTVRTQLLTEFTHVNNIRSFYNNLNSLWLGSGTVTLNKQLAAYNEIKAQLSPPDAAESQSLTLPLVHLFLHLASSIPEIGEVFGLADVVLNFATELTTDKQGNETIDLTSTIGNLLDQATKQFTAQATTTGTLFQVVYQDWGKLNALGTALASGISPTSPWYWASDATGKMLDKMSTAVSQAAYQNIMAAAYAIGSYLPNSNPVYNFGRGWGILPLFTQPIAYTVIENRQSPDVPISRPFNTSFGGQYVPFTHPTDTSNPYLNISATSTLMTDGKWLGISAINTPWQGTSDDFLYSAPSESLRTRLFDPVWNGGLGVYRPDFFNSWPFPRVQCDPSYGNQFNGGIYVGGCNWSAAAPPAQTLGAVRSLPSLTIRATRSSPELRRPQVDVLLTVHNDGTLPAQSITIDSITLRTLGGSGQATIVSPALPIRFSNLAPGASTGVSLRLNVPPGVTRLSLTEQGTHISGNGQQPQVFRFSEAQSLIVQ